jgi:hypothetical protein
LPSMCKDLGSTPSTTKKTERERETEGERERLQL